MLKRLSIRLLLILPILLCPIIWAWSAEHVGEISHCNPISVPPDYPDIYSVFACGTSWGTIYTVWGYNGDMEPLSKGWYVRADSRPFHILPSDFTSESEHCYLSFFGFRYSTIHDNFAPPEMENETEHVTIATNIPLPKRTVIHIPFWLLTLLYLPLTAYLYRKTRPHPSPATAFPVETTSSQPS